MYYYIVNPSSGDRSYQAIEAKLETKLKELGIDGKLEKTLDADDAARITRSAIDQGAQTIVVAGGDRTVNEVITAVHESGKTSITIGIIPLGHTNLLAEQVGIRDWQQACELLAARRLRDFRLMHINDHSFIHTCELAPENGTPAEALVEIDGSYRLKATVALGTISNTKLQNPHLDDELFIRMTAQIRRPSRLERFLKTSPTQEYSQFHARVAVFEFPTDYRATIDGRVVSGSQFRIRLSHKPIHLISAKYPDTF